MAQRFRGLGLQRDACRCPRTEYRWQSAMRFRTWPVAALGLGGLLLLVVVSVLTASNRAQEIYTQLDQLNSHQREVETKLRRLRSDVHLSGIFIRDYLLDPERERAPFYREQLAAFRENNIATVADLRSLATGRAGNEERIASLEAKLDEYWQAFDPLFDWTLVEKISQSASFLKREVLPRREAVLAIASGDRRSEQRQPRHPARRGHPASGRVPQRTAPAHLGQPLPRPRRRAHGRHPVARPRAALGERARGGGGGRAPDAPALAAARGDAGRGAQEPVARAPRPRRPDADRAAHGARPHRSTAIIGGQSGRRRRRRVPAARGQHGPHRPRPRARPPAQHAGRLRPPAGARMARARLRPPLRRSGRAHGRRRLRPPARAASHVRLPFGPGSADQLRAPRARVAHRGLRQPSGRQPGRVDHRRRRRVQPRAAGGWPRPARHRGTGPRLARCHDDQRARPARGRR